MSLVCRFYVVFMSLMAFRNAILLLHNQDVTIPFMSYVISFGHFQLLRHFINTIESGQTLNNSDIS